MRVIWGRTKLHRCFGTIIGHSKHFHEWSNIVPNDKICFVSRKNNDLTAQKCSDFRRRSSKGRYTPEVVKWESRAGEGGNSAAHAFYVQTRNFKPVLTGWCAGSGWSLLWATSPCRPVVMRQTPAQVVTPKYRHQCASLITTNLCGPSPNGNRWRWNPCSCGKILRYRNEQTSTCSVLSTSVLCFRLQFETKLLWNQVHTHDFSSLVMFLLEPRLSWDLVDVSRGKLCLILKSRVCCFFSSGSRVLCFGICCL